MERVTRSQSDLDLNGPITGRKYLGFYYLPARTSKTLQISHTIEPKVLSLLLARSDRDLTGPSSNYKK